MAIKIRKEDALNTILRVNLEKSELSPTKPLSSKWTLH